MNSKTPAEICETIALDFKARKISHQQAADAIGKSRAVISTQISGKKPFSKAMAEMFSKAFGYNVNFLLYGEGDLRLNHDETLMPVYNPDSADIETAILAGALDVMEYLLHLTGNKIAIDAWNALMAGDYKMYSKKVGQLSKNNLKVGRSPLILAKYISQTISKQLFPSLGQIKSYSDYLQTRESDDSEVKK